jgi:hypothetical protein
VFALNSIWRKRGKAAGVSQLEKGKVAASRTLGASRAAKTTRVNEASEPSLSGARSLGVKR